MAGIFDILSEISGYFSSLGPLILAAAGAVFVVKAATSLTRHPQYEWETLQKIAAARWFYELLAVDWEHYCALCRLVVERQGMRILGCCPNALSGVDILADQNGSPVLTRFGRSMAETIGSTDISQALAAMERLRATHLVLMSPGIIDHSALEFVSGKHVTLRDKDRFIEFINTFVGGRLVDGKKRGKESLAKAA